MIPNRDVPTHAEIVKRFQRALARFATAEHELIVLDPSERSLTHRLAIHMEKEFSGWSIDCEYNRLGSHRPKEIHAIDPGTVSTDSDDAVTVFPDIVVHRRGPEGPNLLVVEAKKATSLRSQDFDLVKLRAYRRELRYVSAAFVVLPAGSKPGAPPRWLEADV